MKAFNIFVYNVISTLKIAVFLTRVGTIIFRRYEKCPQHCVVYIYVYYYICSLYPRHCFVTDSS